MTLPVIFPRFEELPSGCLAYASPLIHSPDELAESIQPVDSFHEKSPPNL